MPSVAFKGDVWKQKLREAGLRATTARLAIVRTLEEAGGALSAHEVIDRLDISGMDRVTVYRTLGSLVECGLAHRLDPGDRVWRFTLEDRQSHQSMHEHGAHPHFVCDTCGSISCLDDASVSVTLGHHTSDGYAVRQQETVLRGVCPECRGIR